MHRLLAPKCQLQIEISLKLTQNLDSSFPKTDILTQKPTFRHKKDLKIDFSISTYSCLSSSGDFHYFINGQFNFNKKKFA